MYQQDDSERVMEQNSKAKLDVEVICKLEEAICNAIDSDAIRVVLLFDSDALV